MEIRGYKVFNPEWTCRGKQYTCPGEFEEDVKLSVCNSGMHFCKRLIDCFQYYDFDPKNKVAEVVAFGEVLEEGNKCCTNKLRIVRELTWQKVLECVNTGSGNSGNYNSGDRNSGNWNSGDWNSGNYSNGCFNTTEPKIYLFNKPSNWTYRDWLNSKAQKILKQIPVRKLEYISVEKMTEKEKAEHPEAKITGGYLREEDHSADVQQWWRNLEECEKDEIKAIPNFDKEIFKEITGIEVE